MLSLDFADTAIIETIATAKTIMAIVTKFWNNMCAYNL